MECLRLDPNRAPNLFAARSIYRQLTDAQGRRAGTASQDRDKIGSLFSCYRYRFASVVTFVDFRIKFTQNLYVNLLVV